MQRRKFLQTFAGLAASLFGAAVVPLKSDAVEPGDMLQLTESGIPAWKYVADAMGLSMTEVMKLAQNRLISTDDARKHIAAGMRRGFCPSKD